MTNRTDNFDRGDTTSAIGTPSDGGSAWSQLVGTWGIATNQGYESAATSIALCVLESSVANVDVQVTVATLGTQAGLSFRAADGNNYILAANRFGGNNDISLQKVVAGSFTTIGTFAGNLTAGDALKVTVDGSNAINVYQNTTLRIGPVTESAGSSNTKHGLFTHNNSTPRFDDFSITANGGGGASQGIMFASTLDGLGSAGIFRGNRPS